MRSIVVGLNTSAAALCALRWAVGRASSEHAELRVVTVVADPLPLAVPFGGPPMIALDSVEEKTRKWQHDTVLAMLSDVGGDVTVTTVVAMGQPADVLKRQSRLADMLVLGATRRRFRPVVRRCRAGAHCPVVVIDGDRPR